MTHAFIWDDDISIIVFILYIVNMSLALYNIAKYYTYLLVITYTQGRPQKYSPGEGAR